jgi:putative ABC transport system permease protein
MFQNYLAASLRNLARNGQYAGITIAGLAIAFAAAILIGLFVRDELSYDAWVPGHEQVFLVREKVTGELAKPITEDNTPAPLAGDMKLDFPEIQYTARVGNAGFPPAVRRGDINISERSFLWADPDFFKIYRVHALAGDPERALATPDGLVLTLSAARKYFGRDTPIDGVLQLDGHPFRVAAVIDDWPTNSNVRGDVFGSTLAPQSLTKSIEKLGYFSQSLQTFVRLKPGASAAAVDAELPGLVERRAMPQARIVAPNEHIGFDFWLEPTTAAHLAPVDFSNMVPETDPTVVTAIGVIGALIVVVAAINFVTLMTARASRRAVEVGVRKALGAGRRDLFVQFMGEALLYVAVALLAAVALAEIVLPTLNTALQRRLSFDYLGDPALLATMIGVALVVGLLAGVYPALVLSAFRPAAVLKGGPIEASGGGGLRQALVVTQFCVLIALLLGAITIARQTAFAITQGTHVNQDAVVLLFAEPCTDTLRDAVKAVSGVEGAACSSANVLGLSNSVDNVIANGRRVNVAYAPVDFGFFELYRVKPLAGRLFSADHPADDGTNHVNDAPPIILNEAAARALGYASPSAAVGHLVDWHFTPGMSLATAVANAGLASPPYRSSQVIGVVPDFTFGSVRSAVQPQYYYVGQKVDLLSSAALNVRLDPARMTTVLPKIDQIWKQFSRDQPLQEVFASQFMLRLYINTIIEGAFIAVCALIAVSVACLGLFALSAYTAERRTKEIGIRKAMGAGSGDILKLLLWQFLWPVLAANLIAWPSAFLVMNWWLQGFAYRIDQSPWTFIAAGAAAVVIALATVFFQGLRVSRAKPVAALRYE